MRISAPKPPGRRSGLYIVTLRNTTPIPVNAHDARRAQVCIKVDRRHCKLGKAHDLDARKRAYERVFATQFEFHEIVALDDTAAAERVALRFLDSWRMRGNNNRKNEWLECIRPDQVLSLTIEALRLAGIAFQPLAGIGTLAVRGVRR